MTLCLETRQQWASEAQQWRAASAAIRARFEPQGNPAAFGPSPTDLKAPQPAAGGSEVGAQAPASGLVCLSTSDTPKACTPEESVFDVDTEVGRLKRMKRRVCKAAELHQKSATLRPAMVTLTYANADAWGPKHISEALKRVRQWMARRGHAFRYVWTAELQERGAVHYHVVAWLPSGRGEKPPFWDQQGWWPHGSSRSEYAEKPIGYIVKYASKVNSKDRLPCGARMHGSGGFTAAERQQMAHHCRPTWLRQLSQIGHRIRRVQGGGVVQTFACGLARRLVSPFVLIARSPGRVLLARREATPAQIRPQLESKWTEILTLASMPSPSLAPSW